MLIPERATLCPFRMSINDVFKGPGSSVCVSGRVESGILRLGDKVMVQPCAQMASVKGLILFNINYYYYYTILLTTHFVYIYDFY